MNIVLILGILDVSVITLSFLNLTKELISQVLLGHVTNRHEPRWGFLCLRVPYKQRCTSGKLTSKVAEPIAAITLLTRPATLRMLPTIGPLMRTLELETGTTRLAIDTGHASDLPV